MSGRINLLGGLLALQLLLIGLLLFGDLAGDHSGQSPFLDIDRASVAELQITDADGRSVRLERTGDGWTVSAPPDAEAPAPGPLPADGAKVTELLDKLLGQRTQWPVGTTAETRERFEVTETAFQRKLVMASADGAETQAYLGTSPGYRRVHARRADADEVYSIDFANYQAPAALDDWLDKTLLAARGRITGVVREGAWALSRDGEGWLLDGRAADAEAASTLVSRLDDLRIIGAVPGDDGAPERDQEIPAAVFEVTDDEGTYVLRLYGTEEDTEYRVMSDRLEGRFRLAAYVAEQLLVDADDLSAAGGDAEAVRVPDADS